MIETRDLVQLDPTDVVLVRPVGEIEKAARFARDPRRRHLARLLARAHEVVLGGCMPGCVLDELEAACAPLRAVLEDGGPPHYRPRARDIG